MSDDSKPPAPPKPIKNETNIFGGKNPHGLYVPMSETEQEVLQRLIETKDLMVIIHGWGLLEDPKVAFGDLRVSIPMTITFDKPAAPISVWFLDLELKSRSTGMTLVKQRQSTVYDGQPLQVMAGVELDMVWDIAIHHMSPEFVKAIKPGALGLTSRRLDRETGNPTLTGNMQMDDTKKETLQWAEEGAAKLRKEDVHAAVKVTRQSGQEDKMTKDGPVAPDLPNPEHSH
jgi:hypothetical protein